jgi:hypothetical protein
MVISKHADHWGNSIKNSISKEDNKILTEWKWFETTVLIHFWRSCYPFWKWLATGWWFSPGTPYSSTNKTDHHDQTEILLKVALNIINHKPNHKIKLNHTYLSLQIEFNTELYLDINSSKGTALLWSVLQAW